METKTLLLLPLVYFQNELLNSIAVVLLLAYENRKIQQYLGLNIVLMSFSSIFSQTAITMIWAGFFYNEYNIQYIKLEAYAQQVKSFLKEVDQRFAQIWVQKGANWLLYDSDSNVTKISGKVRKYFDLNDYQVDIHELIEENYSPSSHDLFRAQVSYALAQSTKGSLCNLIVNKEVAYNESFPNLGQSVKRLPRRLLSRRGTPSPHHDNGIEVTLCKIGNEKNPSLLITLLNIEDTETPNLIPQFLHLITHEMRNQINNMLSFYNLLRMGLDASRKVLFPTNWAINGAWVILGQINEISDMVEISKSNKVARYKPFNCEQILSEVANEMSYLEVNINQGHSHKTMVLGELKAIKYILVGLLCFISDSAPNQRVMISTEMSTKSRNIWNLEMIFQTRAFLQFRYQDSLAKLLGLTNKGTLTLDTFFSQIKFVKSLSIPINLLLSKLHCTTIGAKLEFGKVGEFYQIKVIFPVILNKKHTSELVMNRFTSPTCLHYAADSSGDASPVAEVDTEDQIYDELLGAVLHMDRLRLIQSSSIIEVAQSVEYEESRLDYDIDELDADETPSHRIPKFKEYVDFSEVFQCYDFGNQQQGELLENPLSVLIMANDEEQLIILSDVLNSLGWYVETISNDEDAFEVFAELKLTPDLVIIDLKGNPSLAGRLIQVGGFFVAGYGLEVADCHYILQSPINEEMVEIMIREIHSVIQI